MFRFAIPAYFALTAIIFAACSAGGEGGRRVDITQSDDGCTPTTIEADPGEKLDLRVKNVTGNTYEIEGIDGTNLEEVLIPEGRERSLGYTVPDEGGAHNVKCYIPGGISTIIVIDGGGDGSGGDGDDDGDDTETTDVVDADATVEVGLIEFAITSDRDTVPAGKIRFDATNASETLVHELAVLQVQDDGSFENMGEIEDIAAGESGTVVIDLPAGPYQLACLIIPGEAGSTADHYKEGMWTEFTVE